MIDWTTIKTEYITGSISTRKLAEKYGIKYSTLRNRAARDGWCAARYTHKSNIVAKVEQKTTEAVSDLQAERTLSLLAAGEKASALLIQRITQMEESEKINVYEIKAVTEAMKNILFVYKALDENAEDEHEDDGLLEALEAIAYKVCNQDDSALLPDEEDAGVFQ